MQGVVSQRLVPLVQGLTLLTLVSFLKLKRSQAGTQRCFLRQVHNGAPVKPPRKWRGLVRAPLRPALAAQAQAGTLRGFSWKLRK